MQCSSSLDGQHDLDQVPWIHSHRIQGCNKLSDGHTLEHGESAFLLLSHDSRVSCDDCIAPGKGSWLADIGVLLNFNGEATVRDRLWYRVRVTGYETVARANRASADIAARTGVEGAWVAAR